jgi:hypothetical protein
VVCVVALRTIIFFQFIEAKEKMCGMQRGIILPHDRSRAVAGRTYRYQVQSNINIK